MPKIRKKKSMEEMIASQRSNLSPEEQLASPEQGADEESSPIEMLKPFKKAAIQNADLEGTPAEMASDLLPDSPLAAASVAGSYMKKLGKSGLIKSMTGGMPPSSKTPREVFKDGQRTLLYEADKITPEGQDVANAVAATKSGAEMGRDLGKYWEPTAILPKQEQQWKKTARIRKAMR